MRVFSLAICLMALGCASNAYREYYFDQTDGADLTALTETLIPLAEGDEPIVRRGTADLDADILAMRENGYLMVGYSNFNAANESDSNLVSQARRVRATHVIAYQEYTNTRSGSTPLVLPGVPQQQTTYHSGSVYGSGGYGGYSGTSTTTVPGQPMVTSIPYNVRRYDFLATYWVRGVKPAFGIQIDRLSDETRQRLGTNRGCEVTIVVNDTNAYFADVLRGDVLVEVAGESVSSVEQCLSALERSRGRTVGMVFVRGAERREIQAPVAYPGEW